MLFKGTEYLYFGEGLSDGGGFVVLKESAVMEASPLSPLFILQRRPTHTNTHTHIYNRAHTHTQKKYVCSCSCRNPELPFKFTYTDLRWFAPL